MADRGAMPVVAVYSGPAAVSLPLAAPALVWGSVLALTLICVLWLVALIALQPRQQRPHTALSWPARGRRKLIRKPTLPVVFG